MITPTIVLTNGRRDCIAQSIPSIQAHLLNAGPMTIVDDSGDAAYREWLSLLAPFARVVPVADEPDWLLAGHAVRLRDRTRLGRGHGLVS